MQLSDLKKSLSIPSIYVEGYPFLSLSAVGTIVAALIWEHLFWLGLIVIMLGALQFRRVKRVMPELDASGVLAPSDGVIEEIATELLPAPFTGSGGASFTRVRIRGGLLNVQTVFTPMSGKIAFEKYQKESLFTGGDDEKGESIAITISGKQDLSMVLSAPMMGKKLIENTQATDDIEAGDELGLTRLFSICDLYFPKDTKINCVTGQTVIARETHLADLK